MRSGTTTFYTCLLEYIYMDSDVSWPVSNYEKQIHRCASYANWPLIHRMVNSYMYIVIFDI